MPNTQFDQLDVRLETASTLAIVVSSNEPLLFLTAELTVIAASASFCRAYGIDPATLIGKPLANVGAGEWAIPGLISLLKVTASGNAQVDSYEVGLRRPSQKTRALIVNARVLVDDVKDRVRLLVAITDVTDAREETRLKDDLVREKAILMQELQHRIANSLQIIASVLMQSARKVQSEEARGHLKDAHLRVMSIAAVQKQLSVMGEDKVPLRPYLEQLCESLGVSMIADHDRLSISVDVDDTEVGGDESVSLGLIVTELVINALKHAFPDQAKGLVAIKYRSDSSGWTMSVTDDGVGMATGVGTPQPGLGSRIVEALTRNLKAVSEVTDGGPGAAMTISYRADVGVTEDLEPAA